MNIELLPVSFWAELLSLLVALISMKKLKGSPFFYFIPFLSIVVAGEFLGAYIKIELQKQNGWLYNILTIIQFVFWIYLLNIFLILKKKQKFFLGLIPFFLLFSLINLTFVQGTYRFNNYTLLLGALIVVVQCCLYFYQLFNEEPELSLFKNPMFWIVSGAFLFFIGTFFYFSLYEVLKKIQYKSGNHIFDLIITNLNVLFYSCISIGLLVLPKKWKWKQLS